MSLATLAQPQPRATTLLGRKIATPILLSCHALPLQDGGTALVLESYTVDVYGFTRGSDGQFSFRWTQLWYFF